MSYLLLFDTDLYFRYEFFRLRCVAVVNRVQFQDIPGYLKPSRLGFLHKRFNFLRRLCVGAAVEGGQIAGRPAEEYRCFPVNLQRFAFLCYPVRHPPG